MVKFSDLIKEKIINHILNLSELETDILIEWLIKAEQELNLKKNESINFVDEV